MPLFGIGSRRVSGGCWNVVGQRGRDPNKGDVFFVSTPLGSDRGRYPLCSECSVALGRNEYQKSTDCMRESFLSMFSSKFQFFLLPHEQRIGGLSSQRRTSRGCETFKVMSDSGSNKNCSMQLLDPWPQQVSIPSSRVGFKRNGSDQMATLANTVCTCICNVDPI
jgi:hypothetical protein